MVIMKINYKVVQAQIINLSKIYFLYNIILFQFTFLILTPLIFEAKLYFKRITKKIFAMKMKIILSDNYSDDSFNLMIKI